MAASLRSGGIRIHPVHAVLLASGLPLLFGALLSDWAYSRTHEVQWINFAAWLTSGALLLVGLTLVWAAVDLFSAEARKDRRRIFYALVLLAAFVVGVFNALIHARDAGATMPAALTLSAIVTLLTLAAVVLGFSTFRGGVGR